MTDPRWRRLEELFFAAAELRGAARSALLESACGDDCALRQEVESLLEMDDAAAGNGLFIEGAIREAAGDLFSAEVGASNEPDPTPEDAGPSGDQ